MTAPSLPAERETPAGLEAMREAVAAWFRDRFPLNTWQSTAMAVALLKSGPIASELARLAAERDKAVKRAKAANQRADKADKERKYFKLVRRAEHEARVAAEADTTRLRADLARKDAALKLAENPLSYRNATDPAGPGSIAVARALEAVRAALAPKEEADA